MFATLAVSVDAPRPIVRKLSGVPTLAMMQAAVGGYITTGFRINSASRPGISIDYYVNDEGLCFSGNVILRYLVEGYDEPIYLAGSGIFVGANQEGETVALTEAEITQVIAEVHTRVYGVTQ